jgi:putative transcriptional regulator
MDHIKGAFLVASPHLPDPNFFRSVVLMVEHSDEGALGLILNRVTNTTLKEVWQSVGQASCETDQHLYLGGPVNGPLMALHADPNLEGTEVIPHVFFSSEKQTLEALVLPPARQFRIFSGYAGWGPGQLEQELRVGGWLVAAAHSHQIFGNEEDLWRQVTHAIGSEITHGALRIRHVPSDPQCN